MRDRLIIFGNLLPTEECLVVNITEEKGCIEVNKTKLKHTPLDDIEFFIPLNMSVENVKNKLSLFLTALEKDNNLLK